MPLDTNLRRSEEMTRAMSADYYPVVIPRGTIREPRRFIYLHSVAKRSFRVDHLLFPKQTLKACGPDERWTTVMVIPDPVTQIAVDETNGHRRGYEEDGWRAAIDILNPNNLTNDPYAKSDPATHISANCDLVRQGLWPSFHKDPPEAEIRRAEQAREEYYRELVAKATTLETMNQRQQLEEFVTANPDVGMAMDMFGLTASWHRKPEVLSACPRCGERVKSGVAYHAIPGVGVCVINWKGAVAAGIKSKDDVPAEERWWTEEPRRGPGRPPAA